MSSGISKSVLCDASLSGDLLSDENPICDRAVLAALVRILHQASEKGE